MKYNQCPLCGANLDPNENCDCEKVNTSKEQKDEQSAHKRLNALCDIIFGKKT